MLQVFENEFVELRFDAYQSWLTETWKTASEYLSDAQFRELQQLKLLKIMELSPECVLVDSKHFFMMIAPHIQDWVSEHVLPQQAELGVQRMAFVRSLDLFSQTLLEETISGSQKHDFEIEYFDELHQAQSWLIPEMVVV